mmetsp:Transcript_13540/g.41908  ORF Transcript_13540/g.41908 Transcript_13540/m.41908 type:complete len:235 (-) Transcript_13540:394-1098(-)
MLLGFARGMRKHDNLRFKRRSLGLDGHEKVVRTTGRTCARSVRAQHGCLDALAPVVSASSSSKGHKSCCRTGHVNCSLEMGVHGLCVGAGGLRGNRLVSLLQRARRLLPRRPEDHKELDDILIAARRRVVERLWARVAVWFSLKSVHIITTAACFRTLRFAVCPRRSRASTRTAPKRSIAPSFTRCRRSRRTQPPAPRAHARWSAVRPSRSAAARSTPAAIAWARTSARPDWHA